MAAIAEPITQPLEVELAGGDYVVSVARGFADNVAPNHGHSVLIERLVAALRTSGAAIAIASPFARGGRLRDAWFTRVATSWENGFLSLAAHGELTCVVGTIRVFRRDALVRLAKSCAGIDIDSEIILEAHKQRVSIVEVPADLTRHSNAHSHSPKSLWAALGRSLARYRTGLRYRPALWLALPGLIPGLLPLVVAMLLLLHAAPAQAAFWTIVTLIVQYGSLAIFSWQTSSFVAKRWLLRKPM